MKYSGGISSKHVHKFPIPNDVFIRDSQFFNKKITKNALVGLIKILSYKDLCGTAETGEPFSE
jgi:hypothetical protein